MSLIRRLNFSVIPILLAFFLLFLPKDWKLSFSAKSENFILFPARFVRGQFSYLRDWRRERDELEAKLLSLRLALAESRSGWGEGKDVVVDSVPQRVADFLRNLRRAEIVGRDNTLKTFLLIDKGRRDGVEENQVALVAEGVVGRVLRVGDFFSLVETFYSPYLKISGVAERTKEMGVVHTQKSVMTFDYVEPDAGLLVGDTVFTSGEGGIFPRGLVIGYVKEVMPTRDIFLNVILQPAVDIRRIDGLYLWRRREERERLTERKEMERILRELELKVPELFKLR